MRFEIITFYAICDAYRKQKGHQDDPQTKMTTTEVFVTALVAAWFFASNLRLACATLAEMGVVPQRLSESRFCRRRQKITAADWQAILTLLSERFPTDTFAVDSCPMAACHKRRAKRSRLYRDANNAYWGYCAAKADFDYGLKAHVIVAASGRRVEVLLLCGCSADLTGLKEMELALPPGSTLYADKAYSDYGYEDRLPSGATNPTVASPQAQPQAAARRRSCQSVKSGPQTHRNDVQFDCGETAAPGSCDYGGEFRE